MRWLFIVLAGGCSFSLSPTGSTSDADAGHDASNGDGGLIDGMTDAAIDARMIDAPIAIDAPPVFNPATCPAAYVVALAASAGSRYRWISTNRTWLAQHQDCADDLPGATHLAVLDSVLEAQQIDSAPGGEVAYMVGAAQAPGQSGVLAGWFEVTGEAVASVTWQPGQPNDTNGSENAEQDRGAVNSPDGPLLQDIDSQYATGAICECDGRPVAPAVAAFL